MIGFGLKSATKILKNELQSTMGLQTATDSKVLQYSSHLQRLSNLNLEFMWSYFVFKNIMYNIRNGPLLRLPATKSTSYVRNSNLFRTCILWNSLSQNVKYSETILDLKTERSRKYWLIGYFLLTNSTKNKYCNIPWMDETVLMSM